MAKQPVAGRYALLDPLGRGGFGDVWRARDATFGRDVAIKLVDLVAISRAPDLDSIVARFRREALAVGGLRHANIVTAFDAGQDGSTLYLVMELVPGGSLAGVLEGRRDRGEGPLPVADVIEVATQICAGLAQAHAAGVVHRDIKPANLMMGRDGEVKIIDFGIARVIHDDMPRLTAPGSGVGTLAYVAPEQAQGLEVDGRADLYSLGCMMYELLAGERPFVAMAPVALLNKQLSETPPPLRARRPEVPAQLEALIAQLMAKNPADRPASAQEVASRLAAIKQVLAREVPRQAAVSSEAARATVLAGDQPGLPEPTPDSSLDPGQYRPTALASEPWNYANTVDSAGLRGAVPPPPVAPQLAAVAQPPSSVAQPPSPVVPWPSRPPGWGGTGSAPRRPGRRRTWWWLIAAVCAVVAAAAVVIALRAGRSATPLTVTAAAVAPANRPPPGRCNVTVDVVGTIFTNGSAGTASYQWVRSGGTTSPVQTVRIAAGQQSAQVRLYWSFSGRGTVHATATLRLLSPSVKAAATSFVYSCR